MTVSTNNLPAGWLKTAPVKGVYVITYGPPRTSKCGIYHVLSDRPMAVAKDIAQALRVRNLALYPGLTKEAADRLAGAEIRILLRNKQMSNSKTVGKVFPTSSNRKMALQVVQAIADHLDFFKNPDHLNWQAVGLVLAGMPMPFFTVEDEGDGCFNITVNARGAKESVSIVPGPIGSYNTRTLLHRLVRAGRRQRFKAGQQILAALEGKQTPTTTEEVIK